MIVNRAFLVSTTIFIALTLIVSLNCFGEGLHITAHQQQESNWCWAACSETVLNLNKVSTQQCEMANYAFGQSTCCPPTTFDDTSLCNQGIYFFKLPSVIGHFGKVDSRYEPWPVKESVLIEQINGQAPWIMDWKMANGDRHSVLGYDFFGTIVSYMDPNPDLQRLRRDDYATVKSFSGDHEWWTTVLIKPKKITFAIDNTGSMWSQIGAAKAAAIQIVDDNIAADEHFFYTLITFKDGGGNVVGQTINPDEIKGWINGLSASEGAGCQESSLTAVRQAANLVPDSENMIISWL